MLRKLRLRQKNCFLTKKTTCDCVKCCLPIWINVSFKQVFLNVQFLSIPKDKYSVGSHKKFQTLSTAIINIKLFGGGDCHFCRPRAFLHYFHFIVFSRLILCSFNKHIYSSFVLIVVGLSLSLINLINLFLYVVL